MKLRDRVAHNDSTPIQHNFGGGNKNQGGQGNHKGGKSTDPCRRFNKGKCNLGKDCHFDHRCTYCNKFGHGIIVCRKLIYDKDKAGKHSKEKNSSSD